LGTRGNYFFPVQGLWIAGEEGPPHLHAVNWSHQN